MFGWLASIGISKEHILKYEEIVKAGKYLVVAHGAPADVEKAKALLASTNPGELNTHMAA